MHPESDFELAPGLERAPGFYVGVPASTSNLGPGFDFLGLALSLHLRVHLVGPAPAGAHEIVRARGTAVDWPTSSDNLLFRAFDLARSRRDLGSTRGMQFEVDSEIPIARGLGSSGAAVAAGLLLGDALARHPASIDELLAWGLELEGHPDNSSAALLGGCTLSVPRPDGGLRVVAQELHPDLGFALAWPDAPLATHAARSVLPSTVRFEDAVENPRRLALLLEGLRRADPELLRLGSADRLHVAYRLPLITGAESAFVRAREAGAWLATISGSGSALIAIGPRDLVQAIGASMAEALRVDGRSAESRVVEPVFGAARVLDRYGYGRA
jgi:homoserine kinase